MSKKYVIKNEYNEYYQKEIFENGEYIPKFTKHMSRGKIYTSLKAIQSALKRMERKNVFKQYRSIVVAEIDERMITREPLNVKDENLKEVGGNPTLGKFIYGECPNCKMEIQPGMNYCPTCGQKISWKKYQEN